MRTTIIMTVFNRPLGMLQRTLGAIVNNRLEDCELIVVDDGSTLDYTELKARLTDAFSVTGAELRWIRIEASEYPSWTFSLPDGCNNPALALNRAVEEARGGVLVFVGSDCVIPIGAIERAHSAGALPRFARVTDESSGDVYIGPKRLVPFHWFLAVERQDVINMGGFDEEFLKGLACEDDDFGSRLALYCGSVIFDMTIDVVHQSHPQALPFRGAGDDPALDAYDRSLTYLNEKWGGSPWLMLDGEWSGLGPMKIEMDEIEEGYRARVSLNPGFPDPLSGQRRTP